MNTVLYVTHIKPNNMTGVYKIIPSCVQTKRWRIMQSWYINGKHNECEKYQLTQLKTIINGELENTYDRFDTETNDIVEIKSPYKCYDGFKFTENFDKKIELNDKLYYFNLKFVCDIGGAQTRTIREVYNFIRCQTMFNQKNIYFINILDGDTSNKYIEILKSLLKTKRNKKLIFIGDMYDFEQYWDIDT